MPGAPGYFQWRSTTIKNPFDLVQVVRLLNTFVMIEEKRERILTLTQSAWKRQHQQLFSCFLPQGVQKHQEKSSCPDLRIHL